jgi:hypothetical protein
VRQVTKRKEKSQSLGNLSLLPMVDTRVFC